MELILYRRKLSVTSGAGQLIAMQAEGLTAAGHRVRIVCRGGGLKFLWRTGFRASRLTEAEISALNSESDAFVIDHAMELTGADIVFSHNLMTEAVLHLDREELREPAAREAEFFARLGKGTLVVANSDLIRAAIVKHFSLDPARVVVHYPGYRPDRFSLAAATRLRGRARRGLGLRDDTLLIGFVTSGDFYKRGLDIFLEAATRIIDARPDARCLVVGSKRLPDWALDNALIRDGRVIYRPKSTHPERPMAALDLFLYPARFEEYGMVIPEARAMGVPVLTSHCVGAAECLPEPYNEWLLERPNAERFADHAIALIDDNETRAALASAGRVGLDEVDDKSYAEACLSAVESQNR